LSPSAIDPAFREVAEWNVYDANVRVGRSGVHGEQALEADDLLLEMDRFGIRKALVAQFAGEEYDAAEGNRLLRGQIGERLVPAWAALPERSFFESLDLAPPAAVRLSFGMLKHNFSPAAWCAGELFEFLQAHSTLTVFQREDIAWDSLAQLMSDFPRLPVLLLETGYRADRYLFLLFRKYPNFFIDTSMYMAHRQLESTVERFGPDHLVFGSRLPLYEAGAALAVLATSRIPDTARLAIAGGNLRRLFGSVPV
jgi:hypothetical protein